MNQGAMPYRSTIVGWFRSGSPRNRSRIALLWILMVAATPALFGARLNQVVPDFHATDLQGKGRSLDDFSARATVMLFWRPEAERARNAVCALAEEIKRGYSEAQLVTIVSGAHENSEIVSVVDHCRTPVTVLLDRDRSLFDSFEIIALPTVMVLGADRKLRYKAAGFSHEGIAEVAACLDQMFGRTRPETTVPEGSPEAIRRYGLALRLLKLGLKAQATDLLEQLVKDHPEYRPGWVSLGYCEIAAGEVDKSRECLEKAFNLDPKNTDVAAGLAWVCWKRGDSSEAARWASMVSDKDPNAGLISEARESLQK